MTYRLIADPSELEEVSRNLGVQSRIAVDCEAAGFHRYTDRLCLVQLSTEEGTLLFDTLGVAPADILRPILENPDIQVVMHGADFDMRLLHRDLGIRARGLFDTQVAAALLGAPSIGLAALLKDRLGVSLSKEHQRADWARRPLPDDLLRYAASDTRHLLSLSAMLDQELREKGRRDWAAEEFLALESIEWTEDKADPITRLKGARHLAPREATALHVLLAWRDRIARQRDRAPFRVIGDQALLAIASEWPSTMEALLAIKGVPRRLAEARGRELLEELALVRELPEEELRPYPRGPRNGPGRPTPEEEDAADRIRTLREQRAEELALDKGVLLSNSQIQEIIRAAPSSQDELRAVSGVRQWQIDLLGSRILEILKRNGPGKAGRVRR